ncbi:MAG: hypothetical protein DSY83_01290 [Flavobacteriia bacterium]|nr:MAG: hypothetical protein DSY83_01290 [Flavobacteriia bacterium]
MFQEGYSLFSGLVEECQSQEPPFICTFCFERVAEEFVGREKKAKRNNMLKKGNVKMDIVQNGACPYPKNSLEGKIAKSNFLGSGKIVAVFTISGPMLILYIL